MHKTIIKQTRLVKAKICSLLLLLTISYTCFGLDSSIEPVNVLADTSHYSLGLHLQYIEDTSGQLSVEEVNSDTPPSPWQNNTLHEPNFGYSASTYWLRFRLNIAPSITRTTVDTRYQFPAERYNQKHWLLEVARSTLFQIEFYAFDENNTLQQYTHTGTGFPFSQRPVMHRNFIFPLAIENSQTWTIYLRVSSQRPLTVPIHLWEEKAFDKAEQNQLIMRGLSWGIFGIMVIYNLCIFLLVREKSYLYYLSYVGFTLLTLIHLHGMGYYYFWPESVWWQNHGLYFWIIGFSAASILFVNEMLQISQHNPRSYKALKAVLAALALTGGLGLFIFNPYLKNAFSLILVLLALILCLVLGWHWRQGNKLARLLSIAWLIPFMGAFLYILKAAGTLPHNEFTEYAYDVGLVLQVILMSLVMAMRINDERRLKDKAEQSDRASNAFLANMSHEIRTPINAILGFTELSLKGGQHVSEYLQKIESASQKLLSVINDILDFSEITAGKVRINADDFELLQLCEYARPQFQQALANKKVGLNFKLDPKLPSRVHGDFNRLQQVLDHLIDNAIKFTDRGDVLISFELTPSNNKNLMLKCSISDTGIGIAPAQAASLFSHFEQVDNSFTRTYGGTGLGLSISQKLVAMMGGKMGFESQLGHGSRFWFSAELPPTEITSQSIAQQLCLPLELHKSPILILDDNLASRKNIQDLLDIMGAESELAESPNEALERIHDSTKNPIKILLIDWLFSEDSACELIETLRTQESEVKINVLFLLPSGEKNLAKRAEAAGVNGFIAKPITPLSLQKSLIASLGQGEIAEQLGELLSLIECQSFQAKILIDDLSLKQEHSTLHQPLLAMEQEIKGLRYTNAKKMLLDLAAQLGIRLPQTEPPANNHGE
ncbi:MAG: hypothetical protein COA42_09955 [Alteromonadaceae bacterium]|nr:MAG: hypothetical protein COA42_09955 [Alteromonadaceae bacterium]